MSQLMSGGLELGRQGLSRVAVDCRASGHPGVLGSSQTASLLPGAKPSVEDRARATAGAERHLVRRVFERCHRLIVEVCKSSSVPPEFLGALTANESGGDPAAIRFEPAVYRHLKAVAAGRSPRYGGIRPQDLAAELEEVLHPKASEFHARYLTSPFAANYCRELSRLEDKALRELASSWGYTQIMGFHMIGRRGTVRDLLDPPFHFRVATQLLAEFAEAYQLDVTGEFAELFRCWNTGRPDGKTTDPAYVENGLRRMKTYREYALANSVQSGTAAKDPERAPSGQP